MDYQSEAGKEEESVIVESEEDSEISGGEILPVNRFEFSLLLLGPVFRHLL